MTSQEGHKSKMSLHSSGFDKSTEKISIFIKKCKNLTTLKPEGVTLYAKIDFNENLVAESPKIHLIPDNIPDFNFNAYLNVPSNDYASYDDLAYKPVIITLIEVLPKEKKQKEEKVQMYGQSAFDLIRILKGESNVTFKLPVHPTPGSTLETSESSLPELEIKVSIEQPLVNDDDLSKSNFLTVTFESMYALPEAWNNSNKEYAYTASLPVPLNEEKDNVVAFVNGFQKAPTDPFMKQKRWADTRGIQAPNAIYIPNSVLSNEESANVEELGDFLTKEDKEYRVLAEKEKSRIVWNSERRCFLNNSANNSFREQIQKARYWPIEIIRTLVPTGVKGRKDEDLGMSYHGVAYIDMAHLLYPGATQIKGVYKVHPYTEPEYLTKTKRKAGIVDETLKAVNQLYDRNFAILPVKKDQKGAEKKDPKKPPRDSNPDGHDISQSVQQILEAKSFVVIDIKFDKPLIPRKPFESLVKKVSELIPPRPKYPIRNNSADKAVSDYHSQIKIIVNSILEEYRNVVSTEENQLIDSEIDIFKKENDYEQKRRKLLYELNSTGKYFAFKEQLKNSVIKIVREKFLRTSAFNDPEELQQFLSELYVFLTDELHKSLNEALTVEDVPTMEYHLTDIEQMKHFALEAEMNRNFDLAAYYYQERIAREKDNYNNWLEYGVFNLLIEEYARCEECLKECISINQNELAGLILYSVICSIQEKNDVAETFLERVTAQDPENVIAWTLYAILYEQKGQELNAETTFKKAHKLNQAHLNELNAIYLNQVSNQNSAGTTNNNSNNNNDTIQEDEPKKEEPKKDEETTEDLTKTQQAEAKSRQSKRGTITQLGKIKLESNSSKSSKSPGLSAKNEEHINPVIKEKLSVEMAINKSIFMKAAKFLIKYNAFSWAEKCMAKELVNPNGGPSCYYHILLTKIKLAKGQLEEAEKHCCDALSFDYQNCEAWILWSHIRYLSGDFKIAKERYERVLQFTELPNDQTHAIYIRLASIYLKDENYEDSKRLFLYACKNSPSCMSWLGVGICCYRLDQLEEAKNALCEANILNNKAPEVWAYLSLICLRTNKPLEAEQAYKYAIKLNLDNPELLEEIQVLQEKVGFGNPEF